MDPAPAPWHRWGGTQMLDLEFHQKLSMLAEPGRTPSRTGWDLWVGGEEEKEESISERPELLACNVGGTGDGQGRERHLQGALPPVHGLFTPP